MLLKDFYCLFKHKLHNIYSYYEIDNIFFILISHVLHCDTTNVLLELTQKRNMKYDIIRQLKNYLSELENNKPIQYIIGKTYFLDMEFLVNNNVFIPRPETEELVQWILKDTISINKNFQIFDLCSGSGCIGISLKKKRKIFNIVHLIDKSYKSLKIAIKNALLHNIYVFIWNLNIITDLNKFPQSFTKKKRCHIIVSNPPYIHTSEKRLIHDNVLKYEPYQALFVQHEDPIIFYKKIAIWIKNNFYGLIYLYFEINPIFCNIIYNFMIKLGFINIEIKKDFQNKYRMMRIKIIQNG